MEELSFPITTRDAFAQACGEMALASLLAGCLAAVPVALRFSAHDSSFFSAWIPLAALGAVAALLLVSMTRAARAGFQRLLARPKQRATALVSVSVWIVSSAVLLTVFATVLSGTTHHRGLGGATFALVGVGMVTALGVVSWRIGHSANQFFERPAVAWTAFSIACACIGAMVAVMTMRANATDSAASALVVTDTSIVFVLSLAASQLRLPNRYKRVWVPTTVLALVVSVVIGILMLNNLASANQKARDQAQVISPVIDLIREPDTSVKPRK